jgi:hypothetical protein
MIWWFYGGLRYEMIDLDAIGRAHFGPAAVLYGMGTPLDHRRVTGDWEDWLEREWRPPTLTIEVRVPTSESGT